MLWKTIKILIVYPIILLFVTLFFRAVLDGLDLDIEGGSHHYYPEFVREMRMLMDSDKSKKYYITGAPQCPYPDHFLGPKSGTGLGGKQKLESLTTGTFLHDGVYFP